MSNSIPIMEHFYTIQGEGCHSGKPAYFVRTGGCDVGCVWCDVKESWDADAHPKMDVARIAETINATNAKIAVITGGEPLMYDMMPLTKAIQEKDIKTHIETSGAYDLTGCWDWITYSPKKFKAPLPEVALAANELKVIVFNKSDLDWALEHAKTVNESCLLYLQPEWDQREAMMPLIVEFVKQNPQWQISIQSHKYLNVP